MARKIENEMIRAIRIGQDWSKDNTRVHHDPVIGGAETEVYLHGHLIAKRFIGCAWSFNLCGWNTPTTRSRLSAICREFVPRCNGVSTKQGQARIAYRDGESGLRFVDVDSEGWFTV